MNLSWLKKARIYLSLAYFVIVLLIFIDFKELLPEQFIDGVLFFQFVPSLMMFISIGVVSSIGFLIIISLTILFGRIYCSSLCPLGTLQDIFTFISRKQNERKLKRHRKKGRFFHFTKPHNVLRYIILCLTILFYLAGSTLLVILLDPYSNLGRFSTHLVRPFVLTINNTIAIGLEKINIYWLYPAEFRKVYWEALLVPLVMLTAIIWLSIKYGRLYCNTICPVGTFLGWISTRSIWRLAIQPSVCNHCRDCVADCKAGCIDAKKQEIDFSRCVMCFNCFNACSKDAFYFKNSYVAKKGKPALESGFTPTGRRRFLSVAGLSLAWLTGFIQKPNTDTVKGKSEITSVKPSTVPIEREHAVMPPGAKDFDHFNRYCTACSLCVSACPTHVIQPSLLEYGPKGFMQPYMDYWSNYCNYDCKICSEVCPTDAISSMANLDEKKTIQLGKATFIKENCIVYTEGTDCGACSEHCPTKAVDMVPYEDTGLFIPEVDDSICVGCGACEYPCPTRPYKAIYVKGHPEHLAAEAPKIEKLEQKVEEDFPF